MNTLVFGVLVVLCSGVYAFPPLSVPYVLNLKNISHYCTGKRMKEKKGK
jgi:hypothetical protein